jgi:hypothetical protein
MRFVIVLGGLPSLLSPLTGDVGCCRWEFHLHLQQVQPLLATLKVRPCVVAVVGGGTAGVRLLEIEDLKESVKRNLEKFEKGSFWLA